MNEQLVFLLRTLIGCPTITDDIRQQARDQIARLVPETVSPPQVRRFRPMIEGGHIRSMAEIGNPNGVGGWNAEYVLASDYDELTRGELKAFVQLCAPHGKDWLTCPECAKAAGIGEGSHGA